jgi:Uma2 family endonuclease
VRLYTIYVAGRERIAAGASGFTSGPMTIHAPLMMTKEAFLAWIDQREERYEYAGGRAVMMVRVTRNHAIVSGNLFVTLRIRLNRDQFDVASESFAVSVGDSVRFPDVLVQPRQRDGKALEAAAPLLTAEVLSPSTLHIAFGDKLAEYSALPSLEAYLIASQDEPRVWLWQRSAGEFPATPEILDQLDQKISLHALGIEIPLTEPYQGVFP